MSIFLVTYIRKKPFRAFKHTYTHTPVHQATFEVSIVHTPTYIYIVKNSKCSFFWLLI